MANIVKISVGSLGCLGGGKGNLRETSLHDSTCQCEGCVEKRLAAQDFSIRTENFNGERDYGFNVGDEGGPDAPTADIIVLSDNDADDNDNVSGIFAIHNIESSSDESYMYDAYQDSPSDDDTGFDDDGRNSEDAYSAFSPKPYHHEEEESSDSDITEDEDDDDTKPPIHMASIEAAKRDEERINECAHEVDHMDQSHTIPFAKYAEAIQAAKRRMEYDAMEINRLKDLTMIKTEETNKKEECIYNMASDMGRLALRHNTIYDRQLQTIRILRQRLTNEQKKTESLEEELRFTRKRLLTFTRRSVPRRCKRVRRRIDYDEESTITADSTSETDYEDEESTNIRLINIMDNTNDA